MTMTSAPVALAASMAASEVVPQSTVRIRRAPVFRKADQRLRGRAVAFGEPVGDIGRHALPMGAQEALDQRHRGRAVDIVIAEHGHLLAGLDGGGKARGRLLHVPEAGRVGQQRLERGVEIAGGGMGLGAARGQHAAEQLRQAVRLRYGRSHQRAARIETLDPAKPARGLLHAEQRAGKFRTWIFQGRGHATPSTRRSLSGECKVIRGAPLPTR